MTISLLHPCYQYKENNETRNDAFAKDIENSDLIIGRYTHAFFNNSFDHENKKGMILSSARRVGLVLFLEDLILNFPNFQAKNWQNHILFQFLKKRRDKIFF